MIQQFFLDCILVEPSDGAQPAGDGGPGAAAGFQVMCKALDVGAAGGEQTQVMLLAPRRVLAQVQFVGMAGRPAPMSTQGTYLRVLRSLRNV